MNVRTIADVAAAIRGRRQELAMTAVELSRRAKVSRPWLADLESGKPTVELGLVLRVVDALGLELTVSTHDGVRRGEAAAVGTDADEIDLDEVLDAYRQG